MKIAIIGYGPAAIRALEAIDHYAYVSSGDSPEVCVISSEKTDAYGPMFLIKYITLQLMEDQVFLLPKGHGYSFPFRKVLGNRAVQVMEKEKIVVLEDGQGINFDKLLITTGASPITPPIGGLAKKGVFFLNLLNDARKISRAVKDASDVLIIGAGAMGIEAAVAFKCLGKRVKVVELAGQILPQTLSPNLAAYAQERLEARGIEFWLGEGVSEIIGKDRAVGVVTSGEKEINGDMVLITAGVHPNIDLVESTAIKTSKGIIVDDKMETNIPDIYAAGDVAESQNPYGDYEIVFNWYSAISQGWVAGCNLMGQEKNYYFCPLLSSLKEVDFPVISIGRKRKDRYELLSHIDERRGIMEEIYIRDNYIDCYQAVGLRDKAGLMYSFIKNRKQVSRLKPILVSDGFNPVHLIS